MARSNLSDLPPTNAQIDSLIWAVMRHVNDESEIIIDSAQLACSSNL